MNKDIFLSLANKDIQLYYTQAWIRVKKEGNPNWEWKRINTATPYKGKPVKNEFVFLKTGPDNKEVWPIETTEIDFTLPKSQMYNYKDRILYVTKTGNRTQRKGINGDTMEFNSVLSYMVPKIIPPEVWGKNLFEFSDESLNILFEKTTTLPFSKTLLSVLKGNAFGRNLDGRFWISCGILSKHPTVWMRDRPVGELNADKQKVTPLLDLYDVELNSIFEKHGISIA